MSKVFTLLILTLLFSNSLFAVCLTQEDGEFEGCIPTKSSKADKWCSKRYGKDFISFYTTDTCSKEIAFGYRDQEYKASKREKNKVVEASCMYYEDGVKNSCELYNYEPATKYCLERFGGKFLAFIPSKTCSLSKASALRGEVNSKRLVKGLASSIEEAEALMTMLDKQGVNSSLGGGFYHKELEVNYEFYTNSVLTLLAKMKGIKNTFVDNGKANVKMTGKYVPHYLKYAFRYLSILSRVYKLYAYVAHKNHNVLKTYSFKNFEELNLKLKKKYGLEILARVNYKVMTVDEGKYLEFAIGEQDKQTLEYMAMEKPKTKVQYGKLVQYLGVRETLTNHWAVQRLTTSKIPNPAVSECGKGFLSFRPDRNGSMSNSKAMSDLWEYDAFYNSYTKQWDKLVDSSRKVSLLTDSSAAEMNYYVMTKVKALNSYMRNDMYNSLSSDSEFRSRASEDAPIRVLAENYAWDAYSNDHFSSIVMPSDGILKKNNIANRIAEDAYRVRVEGIIDNIQGTFPYVSKTGIKGIKRYVESYMNKVHKERFMQSLRTKLVSSLSNYNNKTSVRRNNRKEKVDATLEVVKKAAQAARIQKQIEDEKTLSGILHLDPENVEELMMFFERKLEKNYDVQFALENNSKWAEALKGFFAGIAKDFNSKYLVEVAGKYQYKGSAVERARKLRVIAKEHAKSFYKKYPFNIQGYILDQYKNRYVINPKDNTRVQKRYMPVFKDGMPAPLTNYEMQKELTEQEKKAVMDYVSKLNDEQKDTSPSSLYTGVPKNLKAGWNADKMSSGELAIPTYIAETGHIVSPKGVVGKVNNELLRLVKNADVLNKKSVKKLEKNASKMLNYKRGKTISESKKIHHINKFVYRVLAILNLDMVAYSKGIKTDRFAWRKDDQAYLAINKTSQAYQMAPILRNDYSWVETYKKYVPSMKTSRMHTYTERKKMSQPLLTRISLAAYNSKTGYVDTNKAKEMINSVIDEGIKNAGSKLYKFCVANFLNYKNDQSFKDIFNASSFLRATIKNPIGETEAQVKNLQSFDDAIRKDIRSKMEALNEDYFEPALKVLGYAALVALAVVLIIGSGGAATPGIVGGIYGFASLALTAEFFISFPLVVGSLYSRINTHFIEMPHQLKFQRSLAQSQVDFSQVVDWDMLRSEEAALKSKQAWTVGLMPLDFIYAGALIKQVRTATGIVGKTAYRRMTGTKLKGWGAPPPGTFNVERFKSLRQKLGLPKALIAKSHQVTRRIRAYQPRYQALAPELLHGTPLRVGLAKAAKEAGVHTKPWTLVDEIRKYEVKLRSRLSKFDDFAKTEAKLMGKVKLNGNLGVKEVLENGIQYSKLGFFPQSYLTALKEGRLIEFITKNQDLWSELKHMQGVMVKGRADKIGSIADKMMDFKQGIKAGTIVKEGDNLMAQMMKTFKNEEILALQEIAKRSSGTMNVFKKTFKDYAKVVEGLRPMTYLYGPTKLRLLSKAYPQNVFMGDEIVDAKYSFKTDAEDLVNYYESMMSQNGVLTEEANRARQAIEERIHHVVSEKDGQRVYRD